MSRHERLELEGIRLLRGVREGQLDSRLDGVLDYLAAEVAMYLPVPVFGYPCDRLISFQSALYARGEHSAYCMKR